MKFAYLGISFSKRAEFSLEIEMIRQCLMQKDIELKVFVDIYQFRPEQAKEMMEAAFFEIDTCQLMIVELTHKAIGVGLEVGYARAKHIPIIYLRQKGAEYSTTVGGTANFEIEYEGKEELGQKLRSLLEGIDRVG